MSDAGLALVIEDDFDASVIFAKALEVLGFKSEVIVSGSEALERLKVVTPEIILLDLHLPGILGTSVLRNIRADDRLKETLVIVATADPRSADLIQDLADLVLIKPTTFSQVRDLASRLTSFRRKKRAAEEAARQESSHAAITVKIEERDLLASEPAAAKTEVKEIATSAAITVKIEDRDLSASEPAANKDETTAEKEKAPETPSPTADAKPDQAS